MEKKEKLEIEVKPLRALQVGVPDEAWGGVEAAEGGFGDDGRDVGLDHDLGLEALPGCDEAGGGQEGGGKGRGEEGKRGGEIEGEEGEDDGSGCGEQVEGKDQELEEGEGILEGEGVGVAPLSSALGGGEGHPLEGAESSPPPASPGSSSRASSPLPGRGSASGADGTPRKEEDDSPSSPIPAQPREGGESGGGGGTGSGGSPSAENSPAASGRAARSPCLEGTPPSRVDLVKRTLTPLLPSSPSPHKRAEACQTPPRIEGRQSLMAGGEEAGPPAANELCGSVGSDGQGGNLAMSEAWNARLQCSASVDMTTLSKEGRLVDLQRPIALVPASPQQPRGGSPRWHDIPIRTQPPPPPVETVEGRKRGLSSGSARSFTLLDQDENLCVDSEEELCRLLSCHPDTAVKVVSIFGNTGDGKSYAMNNTFFCGEDIFETSDRQESCTAGAWAAYDPTSRAIIVDTEGMQAVSSNEHMRLRLLLKVMAISDVVIFCTKAERLHQDMFLFLEDASASYCSYFSSEIKRAAARTNCTSGASVGPHLVIHHETRNTIPLGEQSHEALVQRFRHDPKGPPSFPVAYSDVDYIGCRHNPAKGTDFALLQGAVKRALAKETVRVHRPPAVVFHQLSALTRKFKGDMALPVYGVLPDLFFRCPLKCLSCSLQCSLTVCHHEDGGPPHCVHESSLCTYTARFDNVEYVCQACVKQGRRNVVVKEEMRMMGVMWGHGFRCKECGIVHSSSLINSADKEKLHKLRAEYVHVWSEVEGGVAGRGNAGRQLMEQVMSVANSVASVTEGPVRDVLGAVKTWSMPKYWVPDGEIFECSACSKEFEHGGKKHHCRACGHGFCDRCTQHRAAVPDRGWMTPVRVCAGCNAKMAAAEGTGAGSGAVGYGGLVGGDDEDDDWGVIAEQTGAIPVDKQCQEQLAAVYVPVTGVDAPNLPRKGVESIAAAAEGMSEYLRGTVNGCSRAVAGMVAPDYWEKDEKIRACCVCDAEFTKGGQAMKPLTVHHCRCCGKATCDACSRHRRSVPSREWVDRVRVCDACASLPDPL